MTSRRDNNKRLTLPKEFEEQKRLHHWVLDANCTPIPSRAQTSQEPQAFCLILYGFDERFEDDVTSIAELALEKSERTNWEICERWLDIGVHNSKRFVPMKDSKEEWLRIPLQHGGDSKKTSVDGFYLKEKHRKTYRLKDSS